MQKGVTMSLLILDNFFIFKKFTLLVNIKTLYKYCIIIRMHIACLKNVYVFIKMRKAYKTI